MPTTSTSPTSSTLTTTHTIHTSSIIEAIRSDYAHRYRNASVFVDSGALWDYCMGIIEDPVALGQIVFANDMGVPPVRSLVTMYERRERPAEGFRFTQQQSQYMGSLMGFVFKFVLGYQEQKERCKVEMYGVHTATRFLEGPVWAFER